MFSSLYLCLVVSLHPLSTHTHPCKRVRTHTHTHTHTCITHAHTHTAAESEYQTFLEKKQLLEISIEDEQAELDGLLREMERLTSLLENIKITEKEASECVETIPGQISELKEKLGKIETTQKLLSSAAREI